MSWICARFGSFRFLSAAVSRRAAAWIFRPVVAAASAHGASWPRKVSGFSAGAFANSQAHFSAACRSSAGPVGRVLRGSVQLAGGIVERRRARLADNRRSEGRDGYGSARTVGLRVELGRGSKASVLMVGQRVIGLRRSAVDSARAVNVRIW